MDGGGRPLWPLDATKSAMIENIHVHTNKRRYISEIVKKISSFGCIIIGELKDENIDIYTMRWVSETGRVSLSFKLNKYSKYCKILMV